MHGGRHAVCYMPSLCPLSQDAIAVVERREPFPEFALPPAIRPEYNP